MVLTAADHLILNSYKSVLDGLSEYLGPGYEIVLHSLEDYDHAAIKVINGHYTGRKEGAPITDLAVNLLSEIEKDRTGRKNRVYFNRNNKGVPMRSATFPIMGENDQIIGLLCINLHMEISLHDFLNGIMCIKDVEHTDNIVETYASSSDDLILSAIEEAQVEVCNNPNILVTNRNKEIITLLHQRGIFRLKDSVLTVAHSLGITKNTVYLHLRKLNGKAE